MSEFDRELELIAGRMETSEARTRGLFTNLHRAVSALGAAQPAGLAREERGVLLAFEEILIEALSRTAHLLHQRGEDEGARNCLDIVRRLRELVQGAIESE